MTKCVEGGTRAPAAKGHNDKHRAQKKARVVHCLFKIWVQEVPETKDKVRIVKWTPIGDHEH